MMVDDRKRDDLDLTQADRIVMDIYKKGTPPIEWDESDEAILALSREIHRDDSPIPANDVDEDIPADNVVSLAQRRSLISRVIHSPATGFAMAASLLVGVFVGQGLPPIWEDGTTELTRGVKPMPNTGAPPPVAPTVALSSETLDSLTQAMSGYKCANLEAKMADSRRIAVTGFVSSPADLRQLSGTLSRMQGGAEVLNQAQVRSWPFCQVLQALYRQGGASAAVEQLPAVRPHDHGALYFENESLVVEASATTQYDGYLYVDLIQHDGQVVHMLWTEEQVGGPAAAGQRFLMGSQGQTFTVVPPFGTEMVMVVSSPVPLIKEARPQVEQAEAYLKRLKEGMDAVHGSQSKQRVVSNYHFIRTGPAGDAPGADRR